MPADKKTNRQNPPRPEKDEKGLVRNEEHHKVKSEKDASKHKRVNYIVKDLPIY